METLIGLSGLVAAVCYAVGFAWILVSMVRRPEIWRSVFEAVPTWLVVVLAVALVAYLLEFVLGWFV